MDHLNEFSTAQVSRDVVSWTKKNFNGLDSSELDEFPKRIAQASSKTEIRLIIAEIRDSIRFADQAVAAIDYAEKPKGVLRTAGDIAFNTVLAAAVVAALVLPGGVIFGGPVVLAGGKTYAGYFQKRKIVTEHSKKLDVIMAQAMHRARQLA
jgi:hypothetical protein